MSLIARSGQPVRSRNSPVLAPYYSGGDQQQPRRWRQGSSFSAQPRGRPPFGPCPWRNRFASSALTPCSWVSECLASWTEHRSRCLWSPSPVSWDVRRASARCQHFAITPADCDRTPLSTLWWLRERRSDSDEKKVFKIYILFYSYTQRSIQRVLEKNTGKNFHCFDGNSFTCVELKFKVLHYISVKSCFVWELNHVRNGKWKQRELKRITGTDREERQHTSQVRPHRTEQGVEKQVRYHMHVTSALPCGPGFREKKKRDI